MASPPAGTSPQEDLPTLMITVPACVVYRYPRLTGGMTIKTETTGFAFVCIMCMYTIYVVYLAVALIWWFGESRRYRQINCTPFRL